MVRTLIRRERRHGFPGRCTLAAVLLGGWLCGATARADGETGAASPERYTPAVAPTGNGDIVERVVAVVNGEALFLSELRRRAVPFLGRIMSGGGTEMQRYNAMKELYAELLTLLVDEQLIQQTARELQVSVTNSDIERAIANVQSQSGLEEADFWAAVEEQGFTRDGYRMDVRRQLMRMKVINQKVRSRVNITDDDVRRRYDEMARKGRRTARFHVSQIFLPVEEESATALARVRQQAEAVRAELDADNFAEQADTLGGGDLGWLTQGDLPPELEDALLDLDAGDISAPVRGPAGYHIFLLVERALSSDALASYEEIRGQLYQQMLQAAMAKQEAQFLKELRAQGLVTRQL